MIQVLQLQQLQLKARPFRHLRNNKLPSKKLSLTNLLMKRSKDRLKSSKMKSLRRRLPMPRKKDKMKKFSPHKELRN
jgi:hypothetical protein